MKKLLLIAGSLIWLSACQQPGKSASQKPVVATPSTPGKTRPMTLNGVAYKDAKRMIDDFEQNDAYLLDTGLKSYSAWFSKLEIQTMQNVLTSEAGKTDGVRFYFGASTKNGTKFKLRLFLVTTELRTPPSDGRSIHGDYPDTENILSGDMGKDYPDQAPYVLSQGGLLYGDNKPKMSLLCFGSSAHRLNNNKTFNWVQTRHNQNSSKYPKRKRDHSGYSTESEWFDICFISSLFNAVLDTNNNFDGLRVYLGKGKVKINTTRENRDVFILVPTQTNGTMHQDNFDCLKLQSSSLCKAGQHPLSKTAFIKRYFKSNTDFMSGGYDKGELCPTICN